MNVGRARRGAGVRGVFRDLWRSGAWLGFLVVFLWLTSLLTFTSYSPSVLRDDYASRILGYRVRCSSASSGTQSGRLTLAALVDRLPLGRAPSPPAGGAEPGPLAFEALSVATLSSASIESIAEGARDAARIQEAREGRIAREKGWAGRGRAGEEVEEEATGRAEGGREGEEGEGLEDTEAHEGNPHEGGESEIGEPGGGGAKVGEAKEGGPKGGEPEGGEQERGQERTEEGSRALVANEGEDELHEISEKKRKQRHREEERKKRKKRKKEKAEREKRREEEREDELREAKRERERAAKKESPKKRKGETPPRREAEKANARRRDENDAAISASPLVPRSGSLPRALKGPLSLRSSSSSFPLSFRTRLDALLELPRSLFSSLATRLGLRRSCAQRLRKSETGGGAAALLGGKGQTGGGAAALLGGKGQTGGGAAALLGGKGAAEKGGSSLGKGKGKRGAGASSSASSPVELLSRTIGVGAAAGKEKGKVKVASPGKGVLGTTSGVGVAFVRGTKKAGKRPATLILPASFASLTSLVTPSSTHASRYSLPSFVSLFFPSSASSLRGSFSSASSASQHASSMLADPLSGGVLETLSAAAAAEAEACARGAASASTRSAWVSLASNTVVSALMSPAIGRWADRRGAAEPLLLAVTLAALQPLVALAHVVLSPDRVPMLLYQLAGLTSGASPFLGAVALVGQAMRDSPHRAPALALASSVIGPALVLGPVLGQLAGLAGAVWASAALALAGILVAAATLVRDAYAKRKSKRARARAERADRRGGGSSGAAGAAAAATATASAVAASPAAAEGSARWWRPRTWRRRTAVTAATATAAAAAPSRGVGAPSSSAAGEASGSEVEACADSRTQVSVGGSGGGSGLASDGPGGAWGLAAGPAASLPALAPPGRALRRAASSSPARAPPLSSAWDDDGVEGGGAGKRARPESPLHEGWGSAPGSRPSSRLSVLLESVPTDVLRTGPAFTDGLMAPHVDDPVLDAALDELDAERHAATSPAQDAEQGLPRTGRLGERLRGHPAGPSRLGGDQATSPTLRDDTAPSPAPPAARRDAAAPSPAPPAARRRPAGFWRLAIVSAAGGALIQAKGDVVPQYLVSALGWTPARLARLLAAAGLSNALVSAALLPAAVAFLGSRGALALAMLCDAVNQIVYVLSTADVAVFLNTLPGAFGSAAGSLAMATLATLGGGGAAGERAPSHPHPHVRAPRGGPGAAEPHDRALAAPQAAGRAQSPSLAHAGQPGGSGRAPGRASPAAGQPGGSGRAPSRASPTAGGSGGGGADGHLMGELWAVSSCGGGVGGVISAGLFAWGYAGSLDYPQAPFVFGAGISALAVLFALQIARERRLESPGGDEGARGGEEQPLLQADLPHEE